LPAKAKYSKKFSKTSMATGGFAVGRPQSEPQAKQETIPAKAPFFSDCRGILFG
jgi:hypothetical protein